MITTIIAKLLNRKNKKSCERGFSIMEVMVTTGIMAIISAGMAKMITNMSVDNKKALIKSTAISIISRVESQVKSDYIWESTRGNPKNDGNGQVKGGESFFCLDTDNSCSKNPRHFILYSSATDTTSNLSSDDPNPANRGYNFSGEACSGFDAINGNNECPFQMTLTYTPVCTNNGNCVLSGTDIRIEASLKYKPASRKFEIPFNSSRYQFSFLRGSGTSGNYSEQACKQLQGVWDGNQCKLNTASVCADLLGTWNGTLCTATVSPGASCGSIGGVWSVGTSTCSFPGLDLVCTEMGGTPALDENLKFICNGLSSNSGGAFGFSGVSNLQKICTTLKGTFISAGAGAASCDFSNHYSTALTTECLGNGGAIAIDSSVFGGKYCVWSESSLNVKLENFCKSLDDKVTGLQVSAGSGTYNSATGSCNFGLTHTNDNIRADTHVKRVYDSPTNSLAVNAVGSAKCDTGHYLEGFDSNGKPICIQVPEPAGPGNQGSSCVEKTVLRAKLIYTETWVPGMFGMATIKVEWKSVDYILEASNHGDIVGFPSYNFPIGSAPASNGYTYRFENNAHIWAFYGISNNSIIKPQQLYYTCDNGSWGSSWHDLPTGVLGNLRQLVNSVHSDVDCSDMGGVATDIGNGSLICKFTNNNTCQVGGTFASPAHSPCGKCPSGWTQYGNWSQSTATTCNANPTCGTTCTTGSHSWSEAVQETCSYTNRFAYSGCTPVNITCLAATTSIGCY
ncbi:MAG: prepilin-type N-terminal cleavage/methylation domain-containing protein [Bdellovibrionaceae bacterium]|jgi:type II secretory pathway pseudopilin PulG|nr:prepilin-type N-terminal cleavage/methylation domain-containing protein [Pseudobdellovibrionaceae bacterium]